MDGLEITVPVEEDTENKYLPLHHELSSNEFEGKSVRAVLSIDMSSLMIVIDERKFCVSMEDVINKTLNLAMPIVLGDD